MKSKDSIVIAKRKNESVAGYIALGLLFFLMGILACGFFIGIDEWGCGQKTGPFSL